MKDKDMLKDQAHLRLQKSTNALFAIPFAFQVWQITLCNQAEHASLYRKVRFFKIAGLVGATAAGAYEYLKMRQKWTYYNRFYPEATELQKTLNRDAMMFKESAYKEVPTKDRVALTDDIRTQQMYAQMY